MTTESNEKAKQAVTKVIASKPNEHGFYAITAAKGQTLDAWSVVLQTPRKRSSTGKKGGRFRSDDNPAHTGQPLHWIDSNRKRTDDCKQAMVASFEHGHLVFRFRVQNTETNETRNMFRCAIPADVIAVETGSMPAKLSDIPAEIVSQFGTQPTGKAIRARQNKNRFDLYTK